MCRTEHRTGAASPIKTEQLVTEKTLDLYYGIDLTLEPSFRTGSEDGAFWGAFFRKLLA